MRSTEMQAMLRTVMQSATGCKRQSGGAVTLRFDEGLAIGQGFLTKAKLSVLLLYTRLLSGVTLTLPISVGSPSASSHMRRREPK